jgi:hypothetical protein
MLAEQFFHRTASLNALKKEGRSQYNTNLFCSKLNKFYIGETLSPGEKCLYKQFLVSIIPKGIKL